jgi:hypothetical protein
MLLYRQCVSGFCLGGVSRAPRGARRPRQGAPEATEETILNALLTADDMTGRDGITALGSCRICCSCETRAAEHGGRWGPTRGLRRGGDAGDDNGGSHI